MFLLPVSSPVVSRRHAAFGRELRALDRLFDSSFDRAAVGGDASRTPAMDVSETDTAYVVEFEVPGVSREQLDVSIDGRRVALKTVDAPVAAATDTPATVDATTTPAPQSKVLYRERSKVTYARTVSLPAEVDNAASQARFDNGVLTLTLAKNVPTGARKLTIG